ncbi:histone-lysine N-methyltransferase, H3 lysine-36 and H4 lysine-20 specific [Trichonephila clavipes]|uniref:Histone-lysine N-methyltransferase, H3 lysine-36 and H4 lysine-20 specific n=1 Tax=Trichonephila clavipes TaxID=2585209 RepID=A0A8X6R8L0_TRICX|nr:histone-lysine N-methyltransferase, H3 lysine-36 and H4 lysine-20 specific [Trichonephila clavipes]
MIVWGKFACFRWWPAQIIHPSYLPNNVKKQTHYDGEFAIRYYGTRNYSWTHSGRVYPFIESHKNYPRTKINKLEEEFEKGLKEAAEAFDEYEENRKSIGLLGKGIKDYKHLRCLVKLAGSGSKSSICKTTICKKKASALHLVQSGKMTDNSILTPCVRLTRIDLLNSFEHNSIKIASLKLNEIDEGKRYFSLPDEKKSDNHCFSCRRPGSLLLCDKEGCVRAFHLRCVNMASVPSGNWICPLHFCFICKKSSSIFCVLCSTSYCSVCWSLESNSKLHTCEVCKVKFGSQKNV